MLIKEVAYGSPKGLVLRKVAQEHWSEFERALVREHVVSWYYRFGTYGEDYVTVAERVWIDALWGFSMEHWDISTEHGRKIVWNKVKQYRTVSKADRLGNLLGSIPLEYMLLENWLVSLAERFIDED